MWPWPFPIYTGPSTTFSPIIHIMHQLSQAQRDQVISLLDSCHSGHEIHSITGFSIGVISKIRAVSCPGLPKAPGGCPRKLSEANMCHALRLIYSRRAENAVQIARALQDITNQPLSADTVHRGLKRAGMKAVVKKKKPVHQHFGKWAKLRVSGNLPWPHRSDLYINP